jgi:hypothetical protein
MHDISPTPNHIGGAEEWQEIQAKDSTDLSFKEKSKFNASGY